MPRRVIMVVARCGILLGAIFSSGMMEVAREGIFNPEYFRFAEVSLGRQEDGSKDLISTAGRFVKLFNQIKNAR